MRNIKSKNTLPERLVESYLRKKKIYFSRNPGKLLGKPDFIFRRKRIVLFVDSDFWHGHPKRCMMPKSNKTYWIKKIAGNKARDIKVKKQLKKEGWKVIRVWEFNVKKNIHLALNRFYRYFKM